MPDGNIYALPSYSEIYHCKYADKLWIDQSWLCLLYTSILAPSANFDSRNTPSTDKGKLSSHWTPLSGRNRKIRPVPRSRCV